MVANISNQISNNTHSCINLSDLFLPVIFKERHNSCTGILPASFKVTFFLNKTFYELLKFLFKFLF